MQVEREAFYSPEEILKAVAEKIEKVRQAGEIIDYLTFVPDGEPTLDVNLGREIDLLRPFGIKIALITNASLIWREDVRNDLTKADWVSLKVDAVDEAVWHKVNRPHGSLQLARILEGMIALSKTHTGELATETMLVKSINDGEEPIANVAEFLVELRLAVSYLAIPTRPPAETWVRPPHEHTINRAYQILSRKIGPVELLGGYEGNAFAFTGDVENDLLSITAVHPMREEAVRDFLERAHANWSVIDKLIEQNRLLETVFDGNKFFMRKLPERQEQTIE
jgi:wyosine [tRNA(Phe)-imidazoG37] synthetase (radical SAM superfamily)